MHPAVDQAYSKIFRWAENNPHAATLPGHIQTAYDLIERYDQASMPAFDQVIDRHQVEELRTELEEKAAAFAYRRELEKQLAHRVHEIAIEADRPDLFVIEEKLSTCREGGTYGLRPDGGILVAWDHKCGLVRLCPDESREETQRIDKFYTPAITDFAKAHPTHRVFSAVFTDHNYRPGDLKRGKKEMFENYKKFIDKRLEYCPVMFADGPACKIKTSKKKNQVIPGQPINQSKEKYFPNIKGSLVVQEDPLSAGNDWNVHLNVIFLVKGRFEYQEMREAWGSNVHFDEIGKDEQSVSAGIRELVKYATLIVAEKSEQKAADNESQAPGMLDWPADRWVEWWDAQKDFRRTRSYGCLYALHGKRWNDMSQASRKTACQDAGLDEHQARRYSKQHWRDIGQGIPGVPDLKKKERELIRSKLRKSMVCGEGLDLHSVQWLGVLKWNGSGYWVDLIPGDNFSRTNRRITQSDNYQTGPPPDF